MAVRDALLIGAALRQASPAFEVTILENKTRREVDEALDRFAETAREAECALVYFAGHGVEFHGENYLLLRDTKLERVSADVSRAKRQVGDVALGLSTVLDDLEATGARVKVVILDACRDNPLEVEVVDSGGTRSRSALGTAAGLGSVSAPSGMLVSYAADAGQQANDGLFTPVLCKHLVKPGLDIVRVFAETREEVRRTSREWFQAGTGVYHEPAEYTKLNPDGTRFTFVPGAPQPDRAAELAAMRAAKDGEIERLKRELAMARATPAMPAVIVPGPAVPAPAPLPSIPRPGAGPISNTLGMQFVPVPGTKVLFSVWETRVQDYAAYAAAVSGVDGEWKDAEFEGQKQGPDHPVVNVSWEDAKAFCAWLSKKEGKTYRLPTDHEWSVAVGIGDRESATASPEDKDGKIEGVYPWGNQWPPPAGAGNFADVTAKKAFPSFTIIDGYEDGFAFTAPVGSFSGNRLGLYDLGGNVWEWCEDWYDNSQKYRVLRGGSWGYGAGIYLRSSRRFGVTPSGRLDRNGFRVVLEVGSGG